MSKPISLRTALHNSLASASPSTLPMRAAATAIPSTPTEPPLQTPKPSEKVPEAKAALSSAQRKPKKIGLLAKPTTYTLFPEDLEIIAAHRRKRAAAGEMINASEALRQLLRK